MEMLPSALKQSLYYRLYNNQAAHLKNAHLFGEAPLKYGNDVQMHDLVPGDIISGNIAFTGFYELELTKKIAGLGRLGGTLVDVGANMGYFSLLWASLSPKNKVIAFEASPRVAQKARTNIERNHYQDRITLHEIAVGHEADEIQFRANSELQTGWGTIVSDNSDKTITVPMKRLDQMIEGNTVDVLKIDIEGADTWAILGAENLLQKKAIKMIFFEENFQCMQALGISPNQAPEFLNSLGYKTTCLTQDQEMKEWVAVIE